MEVAGEIITVGDVATVDHTEVNGDQDQDEDVVHEAEDAEGRFGQDVQRWHQVGERGQQAQHDPQTEHVHETTDGEELVPQVAQQRGQLADVVHQLSNNNHNNINNRKINRFDSRSYHLPNIR